MREPSIGEIPHKPRAESPLPASAEQVDRLVAQNRTFWESEVATDTSKIMEIIYQAPDSLVERRFGRVVERISSETKILDEIADSVSKENLLRRPGERIFPTRVNFGQEEQLNRGDTTGGIQEPGLEGRYNRFTGEITIADDEPSKRNLWSSMTYRGLPKVVRILDHEITHHWFEEGESRGQKRKAARRRFVFDMENKFYAGVCQAAKNTLAAENHLPPPEQILPQGALVHFLVAMTEKRTQILKEQLASTRESRIKSEVVAQKAEHVGDKYENRTVSLLETLTRDYGYSDPADIDLIIVTSQVVDRLRVLGFADKQIAALLAQAEYDKNIGSFPRLEAKIEQLAQAQGESPHDLDTRADIKRLEYELENYKAAAIAREEAEALGKEFHFLSIFKDG